MDLPPVDINDVLFYLAEKPPAIIQHSPKKRDNLESLVKKIKEKRKKQLASEKHLTAEELEKKALDLINKYKNPGWIDKCKTFKQITNEKLDFRKTLLVGFFFERKMGGYTENTSNPSHPSNMIEIGFVKELNEQCILKLTKRKYTTSYKIEINDNSKKDVEENFCGICYYPQGEFFTMRYNYSGQCIALDDCVPVQNAMMYLIYTLHYKLDTNWPEQASIYVNKPYDPKLDETKGIEESEFFKNLEKLELRRKSIRKSLK